MNVIYLREPGEVVDFGAIVDGTSIQLPVFSDEGADDIAESDITDVEEICAAESIESISSIADPSSGPLLDRLLSKQKEQAELIRSLQEEQRRQAHSLASVHGLMDAQHQLIRQLLFEKDALKKQLDGLTQQGLCTVVSKPDLSSDTAHLLKQPFWKRWLNLRQD